MQLSLSSTQNLKSVRITTDGACQPNPGRGGWAAILRFGTRVRELKGGVEYTTNNRMELTAVIEGLRALKEPCKVLVRTDSKNTIAWCGPKAFRKEKKRQKLPQAYSLVLEYRAVAARHEVTFEWVRGHAGDPDNERADQLAQDMCRLPF